MCGLETFSQQVYLKNCKTKKPFFFKGGAFGIFTLFVPFTGFWMDGNDDDDEYDDNVNNEGDGKDNHNEDD